jgi:hypothetical protein
MYLKTPANHFVVGRAGYVVRLRWRWLHLLRLQVNMLIRGCSFMELSNSKCDRFHNLYFFSAEAITTSVTYNIVINWLANALYLLLKNVETSKKR